MSRPEAPRRQSAEPVTVLFVCTANICRSAYAVSRAPVFVPPGRALRFAGAGTHARAGQPMSAEMSDVLRARGGDPGGHRSKPVSRDALEAADVVLTMESAHRAWLLHKHPGMATRVFTITQFDRALDACDLLGGALVAAAFRARGPADTEVEDPFGRGPAANIACADRLDGLLARILPRLAGRPPARPQHDPQEDR